MSAQQIKDDSATFGIPVEFAADLALHVPVKIQPQYPMNNPLSSENPLIPSLFQIAARAHDARLMPRRSVLALDYERMLNREKLEAVLEAMTRKKKPDGR